MGSKIRDDYEALKATVSRAGGSGLQATTFVGVTTAVTTYPSAANAFYAVLQSTIGGDETEGAAFTMVSPPDRIVFACNLGSKPPPVGSEVLVFSVQNRWVFFYG